MKHTISYYFYQKYFEIPLDRTMLYNKHIAPPFLSFCIYKEINKRKNFYSFHTLGKDLLMADLNSILLLHLKTCNYNMLRYQIYLSCRALSCYPLSYIVLLICFWYFKIQCWSLDRKHCILLLSQFPHQIDQSTAAEFLLS